MIIYFKKSHIILYNDIHFKKFLIERLYKKIFYFCSLLCLFELLCLYCLFSFFAYICYIIGRTPDDAKVFGEIY